MEEMLLHTENIDEATAEVEAAVATFYSNLVTTSWLQKFSLMQPIRIASVKLQSIFRAQHQRKL